VGLGMLDDGLGAMGRVAGAPVGWLSGLAIWGGRCRCVERENTRVMSDECCLCACVSVCVGELLWVGVCAECGVRSVCGESVLSSDSSTSSEQFSGATKSPS
jgi:hypothetical protein